MHWFPFVEHFEMFMVATVAPVGRALLILLALDGTTVSRALPRLLVGDSLKGRGFQARPSTVANTKCDPAGSDHLDEKLILLEAAEKAIVGGAGF
jgi:hypothetical protein